jgi:tRNA threonylcarbamoyladenosine modification (KEOPS) complex  Pcc1 subunit
MEGSSSSPTTTTAAARGDGGEAVNDDHCNNNSNLPLLLLLQYECCITITVPTSAMALQLQNILQVDPEIGPGTHKSITTTTTTTTDAATTTTTTTHHQLVIQIRAQHIKGLRVSISSFLEYLQVACKCYQEF